MDLQEFVKTALVDIVAGVAAAGEPISEHGGAAGSVQPKYYPWKALLVLDDQDRPISMVEFDIALSDTDGTQTQGGIGVFLGSVGLGSQGASHGESSTHSRIRFSAPLVFPG